MEGGEGVKIIRFVFISLVCIVLLFFPVFAHSGRTDSKGGHNSSDGYHYHHGYSAHDHWDMDGDGILDCPYDFDDQTGINSGTPGTGGNSAGTADGDYGYRQGYDDGYASGRNDSKKKLEAEFAKKLSTEVEKAKDKAFSSAGLQALFVVPVVILIALRISRKKHQRKHNTEIEAVNCSWEERLNQTKTKHKDEIARLKQEHLNDVNIELLKRVAPGSEDYIAIPDGVSWNIKCLPVKGRTSNTKPYGDYTAYITTKGNKLHYKYGCCSAYKPIHLLDRPQELVLCTKCATDPALTFVPVWYAKINGLEIDEAELLIEEPSQHEVKSSFIDKVEYAKEGLKIVFSSGEVYLYYNAPRNVYDEMIAAPSVGKFFHERINLTYPYIRLTK
jgi:hypothetical protein